MLITDQEEELSRFLLQCLLLPKQRAWVRFGGATLLAAAAGVLRLSLDHHFEGYSFFLFIPAVFLAAVLFDHWAAYWATAVSLVLSTWSASGADILLRVREDDLIPLALFALTSFGIGAITEALRDALVREKDARAEASILYGELQHRTRNNLHIVKSLLMLQEREQDNDEVKTELRKAAARVDVIARAQMYLENRSGGSVDLKTYLHDLSADLRRIAADMRGVDLTVEVDPIVLPTGSGVLVGILVNELVTNAVKHAFPSSAPGGRIHVSFRKNCGGAALVVSDNGVGCPVAVDRDGDGSRLMKRIVDQLGGEMKRIPGDPGSRTEVQLLVPA